MRCIGRSMSRTRQAGFTLIELLVVLVIIGILAAICIPAFTRAKTKSKSAVIVGAYHVIRDQALLYNSEPPANAPGPWPDAQPPGVVPPEFLDYLGPNYSFTRDPEYTLGWENWTGAPVMNIDVGLSVHTFNPYLGSYLLMKFPRDIRQTQPDTYTFIIDLVGGG